MPDVIIFVIGTVTFLMMAGGLLFSLYEVRRMTPAAVQAIKIQPVPIPEP